MAKTKAAEPVEVLGDEATATMDRAAELGEQLNAEGDILGVNFLVACVAVVLALGPNTRAKLLAGGRKTSYTTDFRARFPEGSTAYVYSSIAVSAMRHSPEAVTAYVAEHEDEAPTSKVSDWREWAKGVAKPRAIPSPVEALSKAIDKLGGVEKVTDADKLALVTFLHDKLGVSAEVVVATWKLEEAQVAAEAVAA